MRVIRFIVISGFVMFAPPCFDALLVQDNCEEGLFDFDFAVVLDEA